MINEEKTGNEIHFVKTKRPRVITNALSKLVLMYMGKRDGKKGIPSDRNNAEWMSPTLRKEYAKIDEKMAKVWYDVDEKCGELYAKTESLISDFEQNALEIKRIHTYILREGIQYKDVIGNNHTLPKELHDMINSKRNSEGKCDALGLRLRRYNEYNKLILNAKEHYFRKRIKLKSDFQEIKRNYQVIISLESELDIFFWELCSNIERRTSWYWQGVLLKHPQKNIMPQTPPKANNNYINNIHKERREGLKNKIASIETYHKEILELEYVE